MFKLKVAKEMMKMSNRKWVALKTGKHPNSIYRYLCGLGSPDKSTAIAWALALNLEPLALWDEDQEIKERSRKTA